MIIVDGRNSEMKVGSFANLEEILVQIMEGEAMDNRIVTDVLVNDESFSELYPHQAEDIEAAEIQKLEIRSVSVAEMAADITGELYKVITLMTVGGKRVAQELRQAEVANALEVLQDVLEVTRNFLSTVGLLRSEFSARHDSDIAKLTDKLDALLNEMSEVLEQEDWMLMADLTEYEFLPACEAWNSVLGYLAEDIAQHKAA
ncbi:hypothetical protein LJC48_06530 [Desulfovibrio sp. OttesenSCG-928-C06]|nr:hypothetical protein [Desulfovibrio sp. OttesenSCG-928-C06]